MTRSWKCVQQGNSEFSKWSDTIDSTETVEMERQHQRRLVHYEGRSAVLYELHTVKCN